MRVRVIPFGVLKDWLGASATTAELPVGATVAVLLERLRTTLPAGAGSEILSSIAVSVNAEYAQAAQILHDGDEVGLLPPVSGGGAERAADVLDESGGERELIVALTREAIDADRIV